MDTSTRSLEFTDHRPIDCACVIYGTAYSWTYVDRLYNMLSRHITAGIRLHVYTEADRTVPAPYIKHELLNWGDLGPKKSWWYKMQLFNSAYHSGPLLYFDLDTIIVNNVDWIWQQNLGYFWAAKDFKYLWRPTHNGINSSVMWWDTARYHYVWEKFAEQNLQKIMKKHHGDQDFISANIEHNQRRFLDSDRIISWRWQCLDGGYNFQTRCYNQPKTGASFSENVGVLVFHGQPKPDNVQDLVVVQHWH